VASTVKTKTDLAFQRCVMPDCAATYDVGEVRTACDACGSLLDVVYDWDSLPIPGSLDAFEEKWSRRHEPLCFSGVWRFSDLLPFAPPNKIVTIGEGQVIEADVVGSSGSDEAVALHIWDRANAQGGQRGKKNVKLIGDQIHSLLNGQDIAVNGRSPAFVVMRDFVTIADPDPLTVHGVLTMRVQHFEEL